MRAAFFRHHGGPEVLETGTLPDPSPGAGEVLIRVRAVALNHMDLWLRRGLPSLKVALPHVCGADVCGEILELGAGVFASSGSPGIPPLRIGDRVVVNPGLSCGRCVRCQEGDDNLCSDYRMIGEQTWGGAAELLVVPVANLVPAPEGPTDATLAAVPITYMTAWQMIVDKAKLRPGETVLVMAAGSGVGVAAMQIARMLGAQVIAAASTDRKLERARLMGADAGVNYRTGDVVMAVKKLTGGRGADVIIEHTGAATFPSAIRSAAKGGRIVTCGATDGFEPTLNLRYVFWRQLSILGSTLAPKGRLHRLLALVAEGKLDPVVDRILPLEQIAEGHRALEAREIFGKVVIQVA